MNEQEKQSWKKVGMEGGKAHTHTHTYFIIKGGREKLGYFKLIVC